MTLIDKVRTATHSLHQALDHTFTPYIEAIKTEEDYAALLLLFYGFFKPVYDKIDTCMDVMCLPDYQKRRKPEWILADLKSLNIASHTTFCRQLPLINNTATAFGALYVLEGSTMGGVIIRKMISEKLQSDVGLSFFSGYGKQTLEMWNTFIHSLNNMNVDSATEETLVQTAAATFTLFKNWLQRSEVNIL